jgi:polysaccharide deacetylase family protein (PEP-CTERM system associated)
MAAQAFSPAPGPEPIVNAMSVDVEDYYQVSAFEDRVPRSHWKRFPSRVESNVDRILQLFDDHGVTATFFTLGCVAERCPALVRRVVGQGHELASHGWEHVRVTQQSRAQFRQDVGRTRAFLEDLAGGPVKGYRAASYSIGRDNLWALEELERSGHVYSSSIFPIHHDLYGMPEAPRFAFRPNGGAFMEIPVTTVELAGRKLPCAGGGWFRLLPYAVSRWAMRRVNSVDRQPCIFYFHPWEIDPAQPRIPGIGRKARFRHYLNLARTERRLRRLLSDFRWSTLDRVFLAERAS